MHPRTTDYIESIFQDHFFDKSTLLSLYHARLQTEPF